MDYRSHAAWNERLKHERTLSPSRKDAPLDSKPSSGGAASGAGPSHPRSGADVKELLRQINQDEMKLKQEQRNDTLQGFQNGLAYGAYHQRGVKPPSDHGGDVNKQKKAVGGPSGGVKVTDLAFPTAIEKRQQEIRSGRMMDSMVAAGVSSAVIEQRNNMNVDVPKIGLPKRKGGKRTQRLAWQRDEDEDMDILAHKPKRQWVPNQPASNKYGLEDGGNEGAQNKVGALPTLVHESAHEQVILGRSGGGRPVTPRQSDSGRSTPRANARSATPASQQNVIPAPPAPPSHVSSSAKQQPSAAQCSDVFSESSQGVIPRPPSSRSSASSSIPSSAGAYARQLVSKHRRVNDDAASTSSGLSARDAIDQSRLLQETQKRVAHLEEALQEERRDRANALRKMEQLAERFEQRDHRSRSSTPRSSPRNSHPRNRSHQQASKEWYGPKLDQPAPKFVVY